MKSRLLLSTVALFGLFKTSYSQDSEIKRIAAHYKEVTENLDESMIYEITTTVRLETIGDQSYRITFQHDNAGTDSTGKISPPSINKIIVRRNLAASAEYYEEYLVENNEITFYYMNETGYTPNEMRYYYKKNKLIKAKDDIYDTENPGTVKETYEATSNIKSYIVKAASEEIIIGKKYIKLFNDITSITLAQ